MVLLVIPLCVLQKLRPFDLLRMLKYCWCKRSPIKVKNKLYRGRILSTLHLTFNHQVNILNQILQPNIQNAISLWMSPMKSILHINSDNMSVKNCFSRTVNSLYAYKWMHHGSTQNENSSRCGKKAQQDIINMYPRRATKSIKHALLKLTIRPIRYKHVNYLNIFSIIIVQKSCPFFLQ